MELLSITVPSASIRLARMGVFYPKRETFSWRDKGPEWLGRKAQKDDSLVLLLCAFRPGHSNAIAFSAELCST